jgi:hypothetical protein
MARVTPATAHTRPDRPRSPGEGHDPLARFSRGELGRVEAMRALGVDHGTLLLRLGERGLPLPSLPPDEIDRMADDFVRVWRAAGEDG